MIAGSLRTGNTLTCSGVQISPESNSEDPLYTDVKVKYLHRDSIA